MLALAPDVDSAVLAQQVAEVRGALEVTKAVELRHSLGYQRVVCVRVQKRWSPAPGQVFQVECAASPQQAGSEQRARRRRRRFGSWWSARARVCDGGGS